MLERSFLTPFFWAFLGVLDSLSLGVLDLSSLGSSICLFLRILHEFFRVADHHFDTDLHHCRLVLQERFDQRELI